ncbi:MAG: N-acylhomoserine lactone synthase [Variovorax sp.]|jgi:acyl homoserine lactone synthase|nr:N-acylhomoserine lactone synthase [Variovorax sp.]
MEIIVGAADRLPVELLRGLALYRHRVFVEMLGWDLSVKDGMELDQFDRPDTVYVVARNDDGELIGTARLLPTDRPYLLREVFPQLLGDQPAPQTPTIWELSRFAAVDFSAAAAAAGAGASTQVSSPVALDLLRASLALAARSGVSRLISVSPLGVERILRRGGFRAHRAGAPMLVDGHPVFACWIEVDPNVERPFGVH